MRVCRASGPRHPSGLKRTPARPSKATDPDENRRGRRRFFFFSTERAYRRQAVGQSRSLTEEMGAAFQGSGRAERSWISWIFHAGAQGARPRYQIGGRPQGPHRLRRLARGGYFVFLFLVKKQAEAPVPVSRIRLTRVKTGRCFRPPPNRNPHFEAATVRARGGKGAASISAFPPGERNPDRNRGAGTSPPRLGREMASCRTPGRTDSPQARIAAKSGHGSIGGKKTTRHSNSRHGENPADQREPWRERRFPSGQLGRRLFGRHPGERVRAQPSGLAFRTPVAPRGSFSAAGPPAPVIYTLYKAAWRADTPDRKNARQNNPGRAAASGQRRTMMASLVKPNSETKKASRAENSARTRMAGEPDSRQSSGARNAHGRRGKLHLRRTTASQPITLRGEDAHSGPALHDGER